MTRKYSKNMLKILENLNNKKISNINNLKFKKTAYLTIKNVVW